MRSGIKIIKRKDEDPASDSVEIKRTARPGTREMARTVEGWIAELLLRKRSQSGSFPPLPANSTTLGGDA